MERRRFLGAAVTLAGLADPTNEAPNDTDVQTDAAANQPVPVFDPPLVVQSRVKHVYEPINEKPFVVTLTDDSVAFEEEAIRIPKRRRAC